MYVSGRRPTPILGRILERHLVGAVHIRAANLLLLICCGENCSKSLQAKTQRETPGAARLHRNQSETSLSSLQINRSTSLELYALPHTLLTPEASAAAPVRIFMQRWQQQQQNIRGIDRAYPPVAMETFLTTVAVHASSTTRNFPVHC